MKGVAFCRVCAEQREGGPWYEIVDYYEDRVLSFTCPEGHDVRVLVQKQKFEVLLDSGAHALMAGFTLEAVNSFSAALERFYEFCWRVLFVATGGDAEVLGAAFKEMSRQSERQYGAFLTVYALGLGRHFNARPRTKIIPLRNKYVHKGEIPTLDEATAFCDKVYEEIYRVYHEVKGAEGGSAAIRAVIHADLHERAVAHQGEDRQVMTVASPGIFELALAEIPATFDDSFQKYRDFVEPIGIAGAPNE